MANPAPSTFTAQSPIKTFGDAQMSFPNGSSMSFAHPSQGQKNGAQTSKSPYRSFQDSSQPPGPPFRSDKPQIYTAIYSGVKVYEMEVNGVACMRRRADGWLNATQILKVAGVDKGKRTKVLEKEIHIGEHEKRQGGYGRYQGTWISYDRGVQFCKQYGVDDAMRPLLEYDRENDGLEASQTQDTPTKEQAMAANRKRMYNTSTDHRNGTASNGTFFSNISPMSSVALSAMEKAARLNSSAPRGQQTRQSMPSASQQSMMSDHSFGGDMSMDASFANGSEPPRKRMRTDDGRPSLPVDVSMRSGTPTEPNESFVYQQASYPDPNYDGPPITIPPLPTPETPEAEEKRAMLMDLFADQARIDYTAHPAFIQLNPEDYDLPLDASANTALHWAATLARVPLVRLLLQKGANMWRGNAAGQSALVAAVLVNNCSEHSCFPHLLELLSPLIEVRDAQGRTILHHIAVACGIKGRAPSSKYYLEALLEFLVRSATHASSNESQDGFGAVQSANGPMSLMRFLSTIVNAQDKGGNTALNLVARIGNRSIIQQLLEIRADPTIPNHKGVSARDFGVGVEDGGFNGDLMSFSQSINNVLPASQSGERQSQATNADGDESMVNASMLEEQNQDVITSLTSLLQSNLQNHKTLLQQRMTQIDALTTQIQELSSQQAAELQRFNDLKDKFRLREERERKIENLSRFVSSSSTRSTAAIGSADESITTRYRLPTNPNDLSPQALQNLSIAQLRAITRGYERNNASLTQENQNLKSKSLDLERMYRRVVSLCTSVPEEKIDEMLPGLVAAVESEGLSNPLSASSAQAPYLSQAQDVPPSSQRSQGSHRAQDGSQMQGQNQAGMGGLGVGRVREFLALVEGVNQGPAPGTATGAALLGNAGASQGALAGIGAFAAGQGRFGRGAEGVMVEAA
ncbi:Start control protein cdc10-like protein [Elsinoe fawcettii]|nr:Start control protein cdc10-like protein [Elsinoe fawcettii]